jgi:hypothetical protein
MLKFYLIVLCTSIFFIRGALSDSSYFIDVKNRPLHELDYIGKILSQFYNVVTDRPIKINIYGDKSSRFNCSTDEVFISKQRMKYELVYRRTIGHEASHLALCRLTKKASILEEFRFFDEGFANIMGSRVDKDDSNYKKIALNTTRYYLENHNLSLDRVAAWKSYFCDKGRDQICNYNTYRIGSSFVFFIIDEWSEKVLYSFFEAIGKSRNFSTAVKTIFQMPVNLFEKRWFKYIMGHKMSSRPVIVESYPKFGANNISINIKEIYIKFSVPMSKKILLSTKCEEGVCYKNSYWKSNDVLVIKILKPLIHNHIYKFKLGYHQWSGQLESQDGVPFPLTWFKFKTIE